MKKLDFVFIVQGEGRGHMTQAISVYTALEKSGHQINCVIIGVNPHREIPDFVKQQIKTEIVAVECPGFVMDSKKKSVKLAPSVLKTILNLNIYNRSLHHINQKILQHKPDVIVNFYNPLGGLYWLLFKPAIPMVCIAHQYIYLHPEYEFPKGKMMDRVAIKFYTRLTSLGASKRLALSFYPIKDYFKKSIVGFPPLLRKEIFEQKTKNGMYLLAYLVNNGYAEEIISWHKKNRGIVLHCFTDKTELEGKYDDTLFFHKLDDKKFIQMMAECQGLVSTAGFESICEAMYMSKPVFMVPVEGNYEQFCNSYDACKTGTGMRDDKFNIDRFLGYTNTHNLDNIQFKEWVHSGDEKLLAHLIH